MPSWNLLWNPGKYCDHVVLVFTTHRQFFRRRRRAEREVVLEEEDQRSLYLSLDGRTKRNRMKALRLVFYIRPDVVRRGIGQKDDNDDLPYSSSSSPWTYRVTRAKYTFILKHSDPFNLIIKHESAISEHNKIVDCLIPSIVSCCPRP